MKKIRKSIFETNSSSVHSIAFSRRDIEDSNLPMDEDGKIQAHYGSFGSETRSYNDQETKLSYLITLCYYISEDANCDIYQHYCFREIKDAVIEYIPNCTGIDVVGGEPYIDHQSLPYCDIDIINVWDHKEVQNYIFNPNIYLNTGCD